jgi:hypothetical protein
MIDAESEAVGKRRRLGVAAAVLAAALALVLVALLINQVVSGTRGTIHHLDGQGPLGSIGDPGSLSAFTFELISGPGPWTVGYLVCLVQGNGPAVIESVSPTKANGDGYQYIGALIREFDPDAGGRGLLESEGYPPTVPQPLRPAIGFAVTAPCSSDLTSAYTELDLGFTRAPGTEGGGWTGINVGYRVDHQQFVVTLGYDVYVCGPAIPDPSIRQSCMRDPELTPRPTAAGH